ncbi:MAG: hypothetical protein ACT4QA_04760 [Panacagrimonas sp.]
MQIISFLGRAALGGIFCAALSVQAAQDLPETKTKAAQRSMQLKPGETPQGLKPAEWAAIQAQIEQSRYRLESTTEGVSGANPEQGWKAGVRRQRIKSR